MIYITADIHGNTERYLSLMSKIDLKPDDTLYILGDVIDRHPDGIKLLLEIMDSENIKMLLGNHEYRHIGTIMAESGNSSPLFRFIFIHNSANSIA